VSGHAWRPFWQAIGAAALFGAMAARFGAVVALPAYDLLALGLLAITAIDLERQLVPIRVLYPTLLATGVLLGVASGVHGRWTELWHAAVVGLSAFGLFLAVHLVQPKGMGFGDVRLAGLVGGATGWLGTGWQGASEALVAMLVAFAAGAVVGVGLMLAKGYGRKSKVPFAPFLALGAIVAVLWGAPIAHLWLHTGA
jgi:leader peptidase (prepilin peptidase)/N-methyltransferase